MNRIYQTGDEIVPGHRLAQLLGGGSFGEVWQAAAPGGLDVAVKSIPLQSGHGVEELRGVCLVKRLRHPNLAPIHAFWLRRVELLKLSGIQHPRWARPSGKQAFALLRAMRRLSLEFFGVRASPPRRGGVRRTPNRAR